jgi:hypothetical protein
MIIEATRNQLWGLQYVLLGYIISRILNGMKVPGILYLVFVLVMRGGEIKE